MTGRLATSLVLISHCDTTTYIHLGLQADDRNHELNESILRDESVMGRNGRLLMGSR
jgi:hypothetical protein